jgi:hypothetical protein
MKVQAGIRTFAQIYEKAERLGTEQNYDSDARFCD